MTQQSLYGYVNELQQYTEWPFKFVLQLFWLKIFFEIKGQKHREWYINSKQPPHAVYMILKGSLPAICEWQ